MSHISTDICGNILEKKKENLKIGYMTTRAKAGLILHVVNIY